MTLPIWPATRSAAARTCDTIGWQMRQGIRSLWAKNNLEALQGFQVGAVTLAYLDPPFNSGRSYEAILSSERQAGQLHRDQAFSDQWVWSSSIATLLNRLGDWLPNRTTEFVRNLARDLGQTDTAAYIVAMAPCLSEVHKRLSDRGSLYIHCDPAASHYLKILLDHVFGPDNFRNEIVWKRTHAHSSSRRYGPIHDTILFYSKTAKYTWNQIYSKYRTEYLDQYYTHVDDHGRFQLITCTAPGDRIGTRAHYDWRGKLPPPGRHWAWKKEQMEEFEREGKLIYSSTGTPRLKRYVSDGAGVPLQDLWLDINRLDAHSEERVGFETQKPLALLERIISASSQPGDLVLDPFCGTGTTMVAAERLGRQWVGIDNSLLASCLALARLRQEVHFKHITLSGFPSNRSEALTLLEKEPASFALWGTSMLATLADRKTSSGRMAIGTGKVTVKGRRVQLLSWVPLHERPARVIPALPRGRLAKVGFVLRTGKPFDNLREWLSNNLNIHVHEIGVESLVRSESLSKGLASELPILIEGAR
jgi:DNA modification methylase